MRRRVFFGSLLKYSPCIIWWHVAFSIFDDKIEIRPRCRLYAAFVYRTSVYANCVVKRFSLKLRWEMV